MASIYRCSYSNMHVLPPIIPHEIRIIDCAGNYIEHVPHYPLLWSLFCNYNMISELDNLPVTLANLECFLNHKVHLNYLPYRLRYIKCDLVCLFHNVDYLPLAVNINSTTINPKYLKSVNYKIEYRYFTPHPKKYPPISYII